MTRSGWTYSIKTPIFYAHDHAGGTNVVAGVYLPWDTEMVKHHIYTHVPDGVSITIGRNSSGYYHIIVNVCTNDNNDNQESVIEVTVHRNDVVLDGTVALCSQHRSTEDRGTANIHHIEFLDASDVIKVHAIRTLGVGDAVTEPDGSRILLEKIT